MYTIFRYFRHLGEGQLIRVRSACVPVSSDNQEFSHSADLRDWYEFCLDRP